MDLTVPVALHGSIPHLIPLRLLAVGRVRLLPVKSHPAMALNAAMVSDRVVDLELTVALRTRQTFGARLLVARPVGVFVAGASAPVLVGKVPPFPSDVASPAMKLCSLFV